MSRRTVATVPASGGNPQHAVQDQPGEISNGRTPEAQ
jgi:hypothetical protein